MELMERVVGLGHGCRCHQLASVAPTETDPFISVSIGCGVNEGGGQAVDSSLELAVVTSPCHVT